MRNGRILLVSPPVSSAHYPNLALSLLKPAVERLGVPCDVKYFSLDFLERIGPDAHDMLSEPRIYMSLAGEWIFSGLTDQSFTDDITYVSDVLQKSYGRFASAQRLIALLSAREQAGEFIDECIENTDWNMYSAVGFTTSFHQTMAALALAQRVKQRHPEIFIVFGGANCQGEMGVELHRKYRFIDAVSLGESDVSFPELVERILAGKELTGIPGIVIRNGDETVVPAQTTSPVYALDSLPYPDFSDFYTQHARSPAATAHYPPVPIFETSRGCWWGAKHHCTFCGLNGATMAYRSKSQQRAYEELTWLAARYGSDLINADNILDMRYFENLLPRLAEHGPRITMYYEAKANLKPEQLTILSKAGIKRLQPGLESLDSELLRKMDKGCTKLQNVQLLKLAAENGIYVEWLALYGFPGETPEQYDAMSRVIPLLHHLQWPADFIRARADRFSPFFYRPADFGVTLEPAPPYRFLFPLEDESVRRLAYHFDMYSDQLAEVERYTATCRAAYDAWREHQHESALYCEDSLDAVLVTDERWGRPRKEWILTGAGAEIYRRCWRIRSSHELAKDLERFGTSAIDRALDGLLAGGLLMAEDNRYIALALRQPGYRSAPRWEEIRANQITPVTFAESIAASAWPPRSPTSLSSDR